MKFKLDENLGERGLRQLCDAGYDVASVPQQNLCSADDHRLIDICRHEDRCLVTLDLDFANPLLFKPADFAGIAVLRLPPKPTPDDLDGTIHTLICGLAKESIKGKLWIVQKQRIRQYQAEDDDILH